MAVNSNSITDEDNEHSDWLEINNTTDATINLDGWYLTDKEDEPSQWKFPAVNIAAGGYMVIFASDKNKTTPGQSLHTNFKLSSSGEYLGIIEPTGVVSHAYTPLFPVQKQDVSYGMYHNQEVYFTTPTPGAENVASDLPFAPNFSVSRGYYDAPVDVTLTVPGGQGSVYYTTNGMRPTKTNATLYTNPVHITTTTPLSAVVINNNVSSDIVTHTYIYPSDVIKQSQTPAGYPTDWKQASESTSVPADYAMDSKVTTSNAYKNQMENSLRSLPVVNIVTNTGYLFSDEENATTGGIYIYTGLPHAESKAWERPASAEYFDPVTNQEFQLNCRLKLHGGNSRRPTNSPKHGFEITFKSSYGPPKLNFNLFDDKGATNEFNSLVLRAGYNYTWAKNNVAQQTGAQYIQDSFAKATQLDMGQPSGHEKFIHLYLNGLYWGVYNIAEEYDKDFMESYYPGGEDDFDVVKEKETTTPSDGTMDAWNALKSQITGVQSNANYQKIQGKNSDGSVNSAYSNLLDVENYIDYMLVNYYIGNQDWDANNWTVGRNRVRNDKGFNFFCWDAETSMVNVNDNRIITGTAGNPTAFMQYLKKNTDFKVKIADRIKKHLIDAGGALTPEVVAERYEKLADEVELAMISESARWSDWYAPYNPYTLNDHWLPRKEDLMANYFPQRTDILLAQLAGEGLYPGTEAPELSHPTGTYPENFNLGITAPSGTIYYTTDGSDPRVEITGNAGPTARTYSTSIPVSTGMTVKARAKSGSEWSAITTGKYTIDPSSRVDAPGMNNPACSNYPNPFTKRTQIRFELPAGGDVSVSIYTMDGRLLEKLFDGMAYSGENKIEWQPAAGQTGIFICKISYEGRNYHVKLIRE